MSQGASGCRLPAGRMTLPFWLGYPITSAFIRCLVPSSEGPGPGCCWTARAPVSRVRMDSKSNSAAGFWGDAKRALSGLVRPRCWVTLCPFKEFLPVPPAPAPSKKPPGSVLGPPFTTCSWLQGLAVWGRLGSKPDTFLPQHSEEGFPPPPWGLLFPF